LEGFLGWDAFDLDPVSFRFFVCWVSNPVLEPAGIGEKNQPLAVIIKPAGRINVFHRDEVGKGLLGPGVVSELAEDVEGLVEQDKAHEENYELARFKNKRTEV